MRVMTRNGSATATVNDVLTEAGLSTRAFYRHFTTSQDLLHELVERETASVERLLERSVAGAHDAVAAVEAWIATYLDVFYEPRRAARAEFFMSRTVLAASGDAVPDMQARLCRPL